MADMERLDMLKGQVQRLLSERAGVDLQGALEDWAALNEPADVAFTFACVYRDLEPLSDPFVEIYDPEQGPNSPPAYEGLAAQAHRYLTVGDYRAEAADGTVIVRVADDASAVVSPPIRPEDVAAFANLGRA